MNKIERLTAIVFCILLGAYLLYPTFAWSRVSEEDKAIALESNAYIRDRAYRLVNEVRTAAESASDGEDLSGMFPDVVRHASRLGIKKDLWDGKAVIEALDAGVSEKIEEGVRDKYLKLKKLSSKSLKLGLDLRGGLSVLLEADRESTEARLGASLSQEEYSRGIADDIELLRRRVDEYGVSEVDIHTQGVDQIVIEMPGTTDPERVNSLLDNNGTLLFALVDSQKTDWLSSLVAENREKYISEDGKFISQQIEEGYTAYGIYSTDDYGMDNLSGWAVVNDNFRMDAGYIRSVETARDNFTGQPVVNFTMSEEGGKLFYDITSKNINRPLAVVFDSKIKSIATIKAALSTNVQVSGFTQMEADELSIVLKSSKLPVDLKVISSQSVGASLGEDSVIQTLRAVVTGLLILSVFMIFYYRACGVVSVCMLAFNMFMIMAVLSSFGFTLTLTSVSGVILTIGMAADSSIIIFERMKEELREGIVPVAAVSAAFSKAKWTILDANITTMIAAIVLSTLGSTAVKGFAVTLAIGIVCTLLTMLFFSHLIFDLFVSAKTKRLFV